MTLGLLAAGWGGLVVFGAVPWRTLPPLAKATTQQAGTGRVKIFAANLHTENKDHRTVLQVIAEEDPDVIVLPEVDDAWARDLKPLNARYPVHTVMPDSLGNFGMAFWSRLPGEAEWTTLTSAKQAKSDDVPQLAATLRVAGPTGGSTAFRFFGLHPLPPLRPGNTRSRDAVLACVAERVRADAMPAIVAGDLNATRYCRGVAPLREAGLHDAAAALRFSWPNTWSWPVLGIRIDHVLATDAWRLVDAHSGRDIGSDHLPVVATLCLTRP